MIRTMAVAAAQTVPVRGDIDANIARHVELARAAADAGASVLVFPELSLTGYELDLASASAFAVRDPRLDPLRELSTRFDMILVVGGPVAIESRLYLGAFILCPDGAVELYTKHHLGAFSSGDSPDGIVPPPEASVFHPGKRSPLISLGERTAAVAVCADTGRPAHAQEAADRGATVYLASMFVIPSDLERDTARLASYAARHSMTVVFSNYGGPSGGLPSGGRSAIWSERGKLLGQLDAGGSGLVVAVSHGGGWRATVVRQAGGS